MEAALSTPKKWRANPTHWRHSSYSRGRLTISKKVSTRVRTASSALISCSVSISNSRARIYLSGHFCQAPKASILELIEDEGAAMQRALDLSLLASADDSLEHCPPYLIDEVIVNRVASSEHSVDERPIERVNKGFQIEIG